MGQETVNQMNELDQALEEREGLVLARSELEDDLRDVQWREDSKSARTLERRQYDKARLGYLTGAIRKLDARIADSNQRVWKARMPFEVEEPVEAPEPVQIAKPKPAKPAKAKSPTLTDADRLAAKLVGEIFCR